jgi:hypothetical protein
MPSRFCKVCGDWHDLHADWPAACYGHFGAKRSGGTLQIIRDIQPYQAVAVDVASGGKAPMITSRAEHRAYLKRNGYFEVGNEPIRPKQTDYADIHPREIKDQIDKLRSGRG